MVERKRNSHVTSDVGKKLYKTVILLSVMLLLSANLKIRLRMLTESPIKL